MFLKWNLLSSKHFEKHPQKNGTVTHALPKIQIVHMLINLITRTVCIPVPCRNNFSQHVGEEQDQTLIHVPYHLPLRLVHQFRGPWEYAPVLVIKFTHQMLC
jgi:hypothetical protein